MTVRALFLYGIALAATLPGIAEAQWTPEQWLQKLDMRLARNSLPAHDHYVEVLKADGVAGLVAGVPGVYVSGDNQRGRCVANCRVYEVVEVTDADGTKRTTAHLLSPLEVAAKAGITTSMTMNAMGTGFAITQDMIADNSGRIPGPEAGLLKAVFGEIDLDTEEVIHDAENKSWEKKDVGDPNWVAEREAPWLNPFRLFGASAGMMFDAADAMAGAEMSIAQSAAQAQVEANQKAALARNMRVAGNTTINGRPAVHIALDAAGAAAVSTQLSSSAPASVKGSSAASALSFAVDGQQYNFKSANLWIDTEELVVLKHRFEATAIEDGKVRPFFVESEYSDFRTPPGCGEMYVPYHRIMRMGGVLNEADMAQMQQASEQLADFERQLAAMPADQRAMAESMMGSQMDMVRGFASSGAIEQVEEIEDIVCNTDLKAMFSVPAPGEEPDLLQRIQRYLVTLGYGPGNTDGVLDAMTQVAISQFQAESGLEVTGEPGASLANALAAAVASQGGG